MAYSKAAKNKRYFYVDKWLTVLLIALFVVSLIAIYGAIPLTPAWVDGQDLLIKQTIWYVLGFSLLVGLIFFGIDRLFTGVQVFYWILVVALFLLILDRYIDLPFIAPINGSRAWFIFPGIGTFQPSEFMKIMLIIVSANIIDEHNKYKTSLSYSDDIALFLKILKVALLPLVLIVMQPDTGIPIIIVVSILVMLAISQIKPLWIWLGVLGTFVVGGFLLFLFEFYPDFLSTLVGAPYRLNRIYGWLHTERYIQTWGNQLYTSLLAVGSAGWTGHGVQATMISFAEPQNDFIFAVLAKNYGFLGVLGVIVLSLLFNLKLLLIALKFDRPKEQYMVAGLLGMLSFQQIQNMGMIVGILPITGITLPLISYGGSSLLSYMIPLAIIFQMAHETHHKTIH